MISGAEAYLIRAGFAALASDRAASARLFYSHLFRIAPATRHLFVADLERQGVKLMDTLAVVADQIEHWGLLRTTLEDLALRHTAYGVRPEHYPPAGEALLETLHDCLGAAHTTAMEAAWRKVYGEIQSAMIDAGYPLRSVAPI